MKVQERRRNSEKYHAGGIPFTTITQLPNGVKLLLIIYLIKNFDKFLSDLHTSRASESKSVFFPSGQYVYVYMMEGCRFWLSFLPNDKTATIELYNYLKFGIQTSLTDFSKNWKSDSATRKVKKCIWNTTLTIFINFHRFSIKSVF